MNFLFKQFALSTAALFACVFLFAQTKESFNSRPAVNSKQVIRFLESKCWQFSNFQPRQVGQTGRAGNGSIVSSIGAKASGLYTPVLSINGKFSLSFTYSFTSASESTGALSIYLTDVNNEVISLCDRKLLSGKETTTVMSYRQIVAATTGLYKIHIRYEGNNDLGLLVIDDLEIGARQQYANGCNQAPKAAGDILEGFTNREAKGNVKENDTDPDNDRISTYLINDSKDGRVTLSRDGKFSFSPNTGFTGNTTSFTYQACDDGYNQLCSQIVTVLIRFPRAAVSEIRGLKANYADNAVGLKWTGSNESSDKRFLVERSTDGIHFEKVGEVKRSALTSENTAFAYEDRLTEKLRRKNDLYYRVTQTDELSKANGRKIVMVRIFETRTLQTVSVTPNPAVNDIRVNLQLNQPAYIVMKLRTIHGEELIRRTAKAAAGENGYSLEGSEKIDKGVYILEVIVNSNERLSMKLIKN